MPKTLITHNARFHSDDIFACATLLMVFPGARVIRTRDEAIIATGDVVFDVGGIHDPDKLRFDHHQIGGAGIRINKIPYASFGLVWKRFGKDIAGSTQTAERVDSKLVQPIDAMDNGIDLATEKVPGVHPYIFQSIAFSFNPTWKEDDVSTDGRFMELVEFAKKIITREVKQSADLLEAEHFIKEAYDRAPDKRIIELDHNYPWGEFLSTLKEPLYVVRKNVQDDNWKVECVKDTVYSYTTRKPLPKAWAGKRGAELAGVTGVQDAVFCHDGLFLAVAGSREGALKLATIAVES